MIGLDRPVKPEWIYNLLNIVEIGANPSSYNEPFEDIAKELIGKEGKRKVRTVIFRSFIYSLQEKKSKIEDNIFIQWSEQLSLKEVAPLYLFKILMDYELPRYTINKISLIMDSSQVINTDILTHKIVEEYGDRDITKRALRSFLKTLEHFSLIKSIDTKTFKLVAKFNLSDEQNKKFLELYSLHFIKSKIIDIDRIEPSFLFFLENPDFKETAREYHNEAWEYVRETGREMLMMKG